MKFVIIKVCVLGLFCSNLVLATEQGGKRPKPSGKTSVKHKETEDEMLDRLARENAPALAADAKQKATELAQAELKKNATKHEILSAIDDFLQNCKPRTCTATQTGQVLTDSKKCTKSKLSSIITQAMGLNLNAIESLMNLAVACNMPVTRTFSVQQNFAALYVAVAMKPKFTSPHSVHQHLNDWDVQNVNPITCDPRFLKLIDTVHGDGYFFYAQDIEKGESKTAPDGTVITALNKDKIMAGLYFQELQKTNTKWHQHAKYCLANMIFKNGISVHPDGKTDISTKFNQATVAAALYDESKNFIDLADCLNFLHIHPDGITDISTPQKKYAEMGRLYCSGLQSEYINQQIKNEANYNLGARIIAKHITTDPETNQPIANRPKIAAKYWHRSGHLLAKEYLVRGILSGEITEHPNGSGRIQDPDLAGYEILSAINSTIVQRNMCLWMLIAKGKKDKHNEKKLKTTANRYNAIAQDFNTLSEEDRDNPRTQFALGIAYSNLGFYAQAQPYLQFALDNGYDAVAYLALCKSELEWAALEDASSDDEQKNETIPLQDPQLTEKQRRLLSADAEQERQQKAEETAKLVALKKAAKEQRKAELKKGREEARVTVEQKSPSFKIPVTRVDLSPAVQAQKDAMEKILPGKADTIIQELMDSGSPRGLKSLGRNSEIGGKFGTGTQLLIEVKMNNFHRLFYTRSEDGVVTIHQIGGHT